MKENVKIEGLRVDELWQKVICKVDCMMGRIGSTSPHVANDGKYDNQRLDWWTSGFWPGILWILFDMTGNEKYKKLAWDYDEKIEECFIKASNLHHDVGFQFLPTAVIKYKLTGDIDGYRRGIEAANFLAGRYNIKGRFIRAWNQDKIGWSIIDSSMNISLLFWAAQESDDPRFKHIATEHADTVITKFIREDGSVNHILNFDAETGDFIESLAGQGYTKDSSWSRGQAWALYGMANTYKYTKELKYLYGAQRVANYFLANLDEKNMCCWDFRVDHPQKEPRDTSAAACTASGLLEIADHLGVTKGRMYYLAALKLLLSLTENYSNIDNLEKDGFLNEATGHRPNNENINVSLIYGDYFYVEALAKLNGWKHRIF